MAMPTAESHESLSAAYASNYDYLDANPNPQQPPPPQYYPSQQQQQQQQHQQYYSSGQPQRAPLQHQSSTTSSNTPGPSSSSASSSNAALSRGGGSVGSSGSQSYYSSATTANNYQQQQQQQQSYPSQYPNYHQYQQHHHPSPPTGAYRPPRHTSSNYPEHAHSAALNPASAAAYPNAPAPAISSNMYAQSNISMPALGPSAADPSVRAPPLADDFSDSFANMNLYGTPKLGPQRSKTPAYHPSTGGAADPAATKGLASAASVRANAMYANQEIHQSASEVHPENSLAAIADQVDQAAADLDPNVSAGSGAAPSQGDHSSLHGGGGGGSSSAYHAAQAGGAAPPDWNPQHGSGSANHAAQGPPSNPAYGGHYGSGMRQHSAPGEYPAAGPYAGGSTDGHAPGAADGAQMSWDPNNPAAAAYYQNNSAGSHMSHGGGGAAPYPAFQPQALHHASAG